ncbi:MAG: bifunctional aspartate kinase/homoserine dehydrogenase I [Gemmatimonadota bacterium]|nr:bifunctional aspartate kinase/homoserine dehydrogenase I [Gemmatimonadota bacterium]
MNPSSTSFRVLKFGGSSVADADRIRNVVDIVRAESAEAPDTRFVTVVSALGGVTEALAGAARSAVDGGGNHEAALDVVADRHEAVLEALAPPAERDELRAVIAEWTNRTREVLSGISLVNEYTPRMLDRVLALGERVASELVAAAFRKAGLPAVALDARDLLVTDDHFGQAQVDLARSTPRVREGIAETAELVVLPGFIAATEGGETTTLGRGGSDFTASLVGVMLGADRVEIWTDVDGVMSADPRLVPEAFSLEALSYQELLELSHFGAKVIYAPSVHPAREHGIPLLIRNSRRPEFPGTWVGSPDVPVDDRPVRGISSIQRVALIRLEGDGMVGVPGVAGRLFHALAARGVSVILISQASSEHSICFAVEPGDLPVARRAVEEEFALERRVGLVDDLAVDEDRAVIAAVGEGMRDTPGIAGRLFSILGDMGVNVHAIAQGSSELNISLVVERDDVGRALRGLHTAFFPTPRTEARLYLAGVGGVGRALLMQLDRMAGRLEEERGIALRLAGVANSSRSLRSLDGIPFAEAVDRLAESSAPATALVDAARSDRAALRVFVDCTADANLPNAYRDLLDAGVSVVAANKRGFSGTQADYRRIRELRPGRARAFLETTVGAALPVLSTLEDLRATGDRIVAIEGVLSGTLSFLFNEIMTGRRFSEVVREARDRGYTEPDPRDDLSGQDVLRKLVILARESGWEIEPEEVRLEPILPGEGWDEGSVETFMERLPEVDGYFEDMREKALDEGRRLCHLGAVGEDAARVWVGDVGSDHPCYGLRGADNLIALRTRRYPDPLVVRGPGAGHDVTAAGVFADCVRATLARPSGRWIVDVDDDG